VTAVSGAVPGEGAPVSRVAVVTGGASGIGGAISARLAERGHKVAIFDRQSESLTAQVSALQEQGYSVSGHPVDVTDRAAVDAAVTAVRQAFGPVQIVVTSAGVSDFQSFLDISVEQWEQTLSVNVTGTFHCVQAIVPDMITAGWGRIVTISSTAGQSGAAGQAHYVASKGALIALTKALAVELAGNGITANTIPPGLIDTPMARAAQAAGTLPNIDDIAAMMPLKRVGTPHDVAAAAAFLCSEDAGYITGAQLNINGGVYM
jgi:2-hydroxycyclohexanecarboxyl-CoA dehydrogenase